MKRILLFAFLLATFIAAGALNCFAPGTKWYVMVDRGMGPDYPEVMVMYYLDKYEEMFGRTAMALVEQSELTPDGMQNYGYISVEDGKIYYHTSDPSHSWALMCDFSLQPGEDCETVVFATWNPSYFKTETLLCLNRESDENFIPGDAMTLNYPEESVSVPPTVWLDGIGSTRGVVMVGGMDLVGGGSELMRVVLADGTEVRSNMRYANLDVCENRRPEVKINGRTITGRNLFLYDIHGCRVASGNKVESPGEGYYIVSDGHNTFKIKL